MHDWFKKTKTNFLHGLETYQMVNGGHRDTFLRGPRAAFDPLILHTQS